MSLGLEPRTRERLLAVFLLATVFLAGLLSGLALDQFIVRWRGPEPAQLVMPVRPQQQPGGGGAGLSPANIQQGLMFNAALRQQLGLNREQSQRIQEIMRETRLRNNQQLESMRPILEARVDSTRAAIRALLTPQQRSIYDQYIENTEATRQRQLQ